WKSAILRGWYCQAEPRKVSQVPGSTARQRGSHTWQLDLAQFVIGQLCASLEAIASLHSETWARRAAIRHAFLRHWKPLEAVPGGHRLTRARPVPSRFVTATRPALFHLHLTLDGQHLMAGRLAIAPEAQVSSCLPYAELVKHDLR